MLTLMDRLFISISMGSHHLWIKLSILNWKTPCLCLRILFDMLVIPNQHLNMYIIHGYLALHVLSIKWIMDEALDFKGRVLHPCHHYESSKLYGCLSIYVYKDISSKPPAHKARTLLSRTQCHALIILSQPLNRMKNQHHGFVNLATITLLLVLMNYATISMAQ